MGRTDVMDIAVLVLALILATWGNFLVFLGELFFAALALFLSLVCLILEDEE